MQRLVENPLLTPEDPAPTRDDLEVMCTLNAAAVRFEDETLLLVRVGEKARCADETCVSYVYFDAESGETIVKSIPKSHPDLDTSDPRGYYVKGKMLLTSMSHLRLARSRDGRHFRFDPQPAIYPATPYETFGCEDPRITFIDGRYYITYTAVSDKGVCVALAVTDDFRRFERLGIIFPPYQKDVVIFPEKVRGQYVCRHRPYMNEFNDASIWTAYSPDLFSWGRHCVTLTPTPGTWECGRVGAGIVPILTDEGWLEVYHGANENHRYCLAAMLSEAENPERIISRSREPVLEPDEPIARDGIMNNVVFTDGAVVDPDGTMWLYYGAADRVIGGAITSVEEMLAAAKNQR